MKFKDAYRTANDSVHARPELLEQIRYEQAKEQTETPKRQSRRAWWVAIPTAAVSTAVACVAVFVGLRATRSNASKAAEPNGSFVLAAAERSYESASATAEETASLLSFDSYEAVAEALQARSEERGTGFRMEVDTIESAMIPAPAAEVQTETKMGSLGSLNYEVNGISQAMPTDDGHSDTGTNVQVVGVDEADLVKTDGTWIYCLNRTSGKLYAVKADGKDSKITASVSLFSDNETAGVDYREMILSNDRLYVIGTIYDWMSSRMDTEYTLIQIYALNDRSKLTLVDTLKQQGGYRTSRLIGDTLVTVSDQWYWGLEYKTDSDFSTWCPRVYAEGTTEMLAPKDLYINPESVQNSFVLITTIDTKTGAQFDSHKAVFGGSDVVYCNETRLLIASGETEYLNGEEQTDENGKHYVKNITRRYTALCLFDIENGKIVPIATQKVEGTLLNQFSMDAYDGTFRMVVTRNTQEETIWTDGIDTYEFNSVRDCALYTLDALLQPLGSVENLGENETVQSVRFMGSIAYFVTFRQTDPLFAVDLSDPTHPSVLSALKIPGFSAYLHPFGEGRLLGIGYSANEKTGITDGVKLTLFDISDPSDVKVLETKQIKASYTTVQYNHKAVFVDASSGTVAFPADNRYYVFRVGDDGIEERGAIEIGEYSWDGGARGVKLSDAFYVVTEEATVVLSFDTMKKLTEVLFR